MAAAPFQTSVLGIGTHYQSTELKADLPASWRTPVDHIKVPDPSQPVFAQFLQSQLLIDRLEAVASSLWLAGRPMPPRPLHRQVQMGRSIVTTEDMGLHLVWSKSQIFVKPLPRYLLVPAFWTQHLAGPHHVRLRKVAYGYLFSYTALISYESDFEIARSQHLVPAEMPWNAWKALVEELLAEPPYPHVSPRFLYGELRLSRLNALYRFKYGHLLRGYSTVTAHTGYGSFLADNYAVLAALLAYALVVLQCMQVGLATDILQRAKAFQRASYGFTVFLMVTTVASCLAVLLVLIYAVSSNWIATNRYNTRRFAAMSVGLPLKDHV